MSEKLNHLEVRAPAKVNLFLEVLGERDDGYHDIRSIVAPVSLCDDVCLERVDHGVEVEIECENGAVAGFSVMDEDNLAVRAARALKSAVGYEGGVRIRIQKRIPVGGGLGGGSSDAAAVLTGLNSLWEIGLPMARLMEIGATVGCDVPALLCGGLVLMEGVGERVKPLQVGEGVDWWLVVVFPGISSSTEDIYSRVSPVLTSAERPYRNMCFALERGDLGLAAEGLFNSLQTTVFHKYPLIQMFAEDLVSAGALGSLVSGSGSTVFALANGEKDAHRLAGAFVRKHGPPVWCDVVRTLPDGVMVAHGPLEA